MRDVTTQEALVSPVAGAVGGVVTLTGGGVLWFCKPSPLPIQTHLLDLQRPEQKLHILAAISPSATRPPPAVNCDPNPEPEETF